MVLICGVKFAFLPKPQSIGASLALKKWGDWNVALWVSKNMYPNLTFCVAIIPYKEQKTVPFILIYVLVFLFIIFFLFPLISPLSFSCHAPLLPLPSIYFPSLIDCFLWTIPSLPLFSLKWETPSCILVSVVICVLQHHQVVQNKESQCALVS